MKWNEVFCNTFEAIWKDIGPEVSRKLDFMLPSMPMVEACRAEDFDFFQPFIESGDLTTGQMHHAAERYRLGKTRTGKPIFWMIDDMRQPLDARIGSDEWISGLLKAREPELLQSWPVRHCLFGLHLLGSEERKVKSEKYRAVAIVESEVSAVILSEIFPESIWMAYTSVSHLTPDLFEPLQGRTVTVYPRTDDTKSTYVFFLQFASHVRSLYPINISIDSTLEDHATAAQKSRNIDLLDFIR